MIRERLSVAIRRRLPWGKSTETDPQTRAVELLHRLPNEDVILTGKLSVNIIRSRMDEDLGWNAKDAWTALTEARKAQNRDTDQDYSAIISQAQFQHGYAFARELESDAKRAKRNQLIKKVAWSLTIVGPVFDGLVAVVDELQEQMKESEARDRALREAQIQEQIRANNDPKNRAYWERVARGQDSAE